MYSTGRRCKCFGCIRKSTVLEFDFQDSIAPAFASDDPLPVTAVATLIQHNTSGIISRKGEGMDRPKGMEGKTYATWDMEVEKAMIKKRGGI